MHAFEHVRLDCDVDAVTWNGAAQIGHSRVSVPAFADAQARAHSLEHVRRTLALAGTSCTGFPQIAQAVTIFSPALWVASHRSRHARSQKWCPVFAAAQLRCL